MAERVRRCAYINCSKPLPAVSRSDRRFCGPACRQAYRRWRRHQAEAITIGFWYVLGRETQDVVCCPVCGRRFALGHGHRRDSIYDRPACRQAAYRARRATREGVSVAVTARGTVTATDTLSKPLSSAKATLEKAPARMSARSS